MPNTTLGATTGRRRFTDAVGEFSTVLGPGTSFEGTFEGSTNVRILGGFRGSIRIEGLVWLGPEARFDGGVEATDVVVEGTLRGTIHGAGKVELRASCHVEADISAPTVAAAEGSFFEGAITMAGDSGRRMVTYREKREDSDIPAVKEDAPDEPGEASSEAPPEAADTAPPRES